MSFRKSLFCLLSSILVSAFVVTAQDQQQTTNQQEQLRSARQQERAARMRERMGRHEGRMRHRMGRECGHFLRDLNLSEAQQQQRRAIVERRLAATKTQREELMKFREKRVAGTFSAEDAARVKELRQQIRSSMEGMRGELESVLTTEQRARLEELKKERKARMEQRMQERQQRLQERLREHSNPRSQEL